MNKPREKLIVLIIICFLVIIFVFIPYIKVEILTNKYFNEFAELYKLCNMIDQIDYYKVYDYSTTSARIYYVAKNKSSGNIFEFSKKDGEWILKDWKTIWSDSGSADGFIWPYYR